MKYLRIILSLVTACFAMAYLSGCQKEEELGIDQDYGHVQFKLYKEASYPMTKAVVSQLEYLHDVAKIRVELRYEDNDINQTLVMSSADDESAEFGLRSDKLKLLAGRYEILTFTLYDKLDEPLYVSTPTSDFSAFEIIAGGLCVHDLVANTVERGKVRFNLVKDMSGFKNNPATKAVVREYTFDQIGYASVSVRTGNTTTSFEMLPVDYSVHFSDDGVEDGYQTSSFECDSLLSIRAGEYRIVSYSVYDKNKKLLETNNDVDSKFIVTDNRTTEVDVPVTLREAAEHIKDYYALYEIWKALDGENWRYVGESYTYGTNWDFNKDVDLWGEQPGVFLHSNGRVSSLDISNFGFQGDMPDAIGQLTELVELYLGTHDDTDNLYTPTQMSEPIARALMENGIDIPEIQLHKLYSEDEIIEKGTGRMLQRPGLKDANYGVITNGLTSLPESIGNLTKLEKFYIANGKLKSLPSSIRNMQSLTDVEIYNCPEMKEFPDVLAELPSLISLLISNNYQWSAEDLYDGLKALADGPARDEIQMLYVNQNNLEKVPANFSNLIKLGLLDLADNKITEFEAPLGQNVNPVQFYVDNNYLKSFPKDENGMFCGIEDVETFSARNNLLEKFPNIFDANSIYSIASMDFSYNPMDGFEDEEKGYGKDGYRGLKGETVTINNCLNMTKYPVAFAKTNSLLAYLSMRGCRVDEIPEGSFVYENSINLVSLDLSYNSLKDLPFEMHSGNLPYLYGVDVSYNQFSSFPWEPLDSGYLTVFAVRGQRDANGERCLSEWPTGLYNHKSLRGFYIGSNNLGKIDDTISYLIYYLDISDNPNIVFDASDICSAYYSGSFFLIYDKTQDIRNCDIMLN